MSIADDVPGDLDASAVALVRDLGLAEPDRALCPALIRVAHGLFERRPGQGVTKATLIGEIAGLPGSSWTAWTSPIPSSQPSCRFR